MSGEQSHHSHHHCSNHGEKRADIWSNLSTGGGLVSTFFNTGTTFGSAVDIVTGQEAKLLSYSYPAFAVGVFMGLLTAIGTAYSHRFLNIYHQQKENSCNQDSLVVITQGGKTHSLSTDSSSLPAFLPAPSEDANNSAESLDNSRSKFTWPQRGALFFDGVSHSLGRVSGMYFWMLKVTKDSMPRWGSGLLLLGLVVGGALTSVADIRSCADSIEKESKGRSANTVNESTPLRFGF